MFPSLRSKIIFSFSLLMVVGAVVSALLVRRNMARTLGVTADRSGFAFARTLAGQVAEEESAADHLVRPIHQRDRHDEAEAHPIPSCATLL